MEPINSAAQNLELALTYQDIIEEAERSLIHRLRTHTGNEICLIYGVPRGGAVLAGLIQTKWPKHFGVVDSPEKADVIIDDLVDSGATRDRYRDKYPLTPFEVLYDKIRDESVRGRWLVFPWEGEALRDTEDIVTRLLEFLGEDPNREGLVDTPRRYLKFWKEFLSPDPFSFTKFENEGGHEMIIVKDIVMHSVCEHHLAPFFGVAHVAYIPGDHILGISKLPRCVDHYSRRLQNQERITNQVAKRIMKEANALGVAVMIEAEHTCMSMRGIKAHGASTQTFTFLGSMQEVENRDQFLSSIR